MATNGIIKFSDTDYTGGMTFQLSWERVSYSYNNNSSTLSWTLKILTNGLSRITDSSATYIVSFDGIDYTGNCDPSVGIYGEKVLATGSTTIYHEVDGSKRFSVSLAINGLSGYKDGRISAGASHILDNLLGAYATIIGAPSFTDEENPVITYNNPQGDKVESLQACIALYNSESKQWHATGAPYREISKTGTSYTFELTDAERKALRKAVTWGNTVNVRFYVRTTLGGQYFFSSINKTLTLVNHAPTLSPVIRDTGSSSVALTNDPTKIIKYFNVMSINMRAEAKKEAVLTSQTVTCGGKTVSSTGTASLSDFLSYIESGTFECSIRDSRGLRESATVSLDLIEYFKPTCNFDTKPATTDGNMEIGAYGTFFNDYFGDEGTAQHNSLTIQYRIKANDNGFGAWQTIPAANITIDGNDYDFTYTISGLDYLNAYTVEVMVNDKVTRYPATRSQTRKTASIFDWGQDDFNFNVDVNFSDEAHFKKKANFEDGAYFDNHKGIYGISSSGSELWNIIPCNNNDNLILGYGGYTEGVGGTNIYGNTVNVMTKGDFKINNEKSLLGLYKAMTGSYGFATATGNMSVTPGPNYTSIVNANAILVGNQIRLMLTANRSSAVNGDIANEKVATITINHGEKIAAFFNTSFGNGGAGGVASFYTTSATMPTADTLQFDIMLAAATPSSSQFSIIATLPIAINPEFYV